MGEKAKSATFEAVKGEAEPAVLKRGTLKHPNRLQFALRSCVVQKGDRIAERSRSCRAPPRSELYLRCERVGRRDVDVARTGVGDNPISTIRDSVKGGTLGPEPGSIQLEENRGPVSGSFLRSSGRRLLERGIGSKTRPLRAPVGVPQPEPADICCALAANPL